MEERNEQAVDDRGTTEAGGREILKRLRDEGFEANDEKLAVALGRPVEVVQSWTAGDSSSGEPVDDDIIMKARGIAKERGIELE
ncbi:MAG TPA: hypothetical protein VGO96_04420 [Pyrinomonadaceae bacterium]|jgi:hypothetical protein|nr:hypothetical protein [Pyrinomonadaceae bacterium]